MKLSGSCLSDLASISVRGTDFFLFNTSIWYMKFTQSLFEGVKDTEDKEVGT